MDIVCNHFVHYSKLLIYLQKQRKFTLTKESFDLLTIYVQEVVLRLLLYCIITIIVHNIIPKNKECSVEANTTKGKIKQI